MRWILPVMVAASVAVAGCGGDGEETASTSPTGPAATAAPKPAFSDFQPLEAGKSYTTGAFRPAMRFTVPPGTWTSEVGDTAEHFAVAAVNPAEPVDQAIISAHRFTRVFDADRGGRQPGDTVPLDGGFAEWLRSHPHLRTTEPEPVELLGLRGVQLDVTTRSSPPVVPDDCGKVGSGCVPLFHDGLDTVLYAATTKGRFTVLDLPDGKELVLEEFAEPRGAFARALRVLRPLRERLALAAG